MFDIYLDKIVYHNDYGLDNPDQKNALSQITEIFQQNMSGL